MMMQGIVWPQQRGGEAASPFMRGQNERPIRLTFHSSSFHGAAPNEVKAVELLRGLCHQEEVEGIDEAEGKLARLSLERYDDLDSPIEIKVESASTKRRCIMRNPAHAVRSLSTDLSGPLTSGGKVELLLAQAHIELHQDLLVTLSPDLLAGRNGSVLGKSNPITPSEALKIVGLMLRSRHNFVQDSDEGYQYSFNRGLFYLVLTRHRLPAFWRYFSACVYADPYRDDNILHLGQSVMMRCIRAHEARDTIGQQFFLPQNNDTRDAMMYHFDYLTLLLAGALDAEARVACRAYGVSFKEKYASFRKPDFMNALRATGAYALAEAVADARFASFLTLLFEPRNTIHEAALSTLSYQAPPAQQRSFVTIPPSHEERMVRAADICGGSKAWGLQRIHKPVFEPFAYAQNLLREGLIHINEVAARTDTLRLFQAGAPLPDLLDGPPDDDIFRATIRERLDLLG